jgi:hypothetical protein
MSEASRSILISSDTASGRHADEVLLAAAVRLLEQRAGARIVAISPRPQLTERAHPSVRSIAADGLDETLDGAAQLVVVGQFRAPASLERAAQHVVRAKLSGIPVALVSVHVDASLAAQLDILGQSDSLSAADHATARRLRTASGRKVETTAPLELILGLQEAAPRDVIQVCTDVLDRMSARERAALHAAIAAVTGATGAALEILGLQPDPGRESIRQVPTAVDWVRAVASARVHVGLSGATSLHVALLHGAVPVAWRPSDGADARLHERVGLHDLELGSGAEMDAWRVALARAYAADRIEVRSRCLPLRSVAWRALAGVSEAVRSQPFAPAQLSAQGRATFAAALAAKVRPALERGDAVASERLLDAWRPHVETEPRWAEARARTWSLLGCDGEARRTLEQAIAAAPDDAGCQAALAMVAWRLGDTAAARRAWQRVCVLDPGSSLAAQQLACLEVLEGSRVDAAPPQDAPRPAVLATLDALHDAPTPRESAP